MIGIEVVLILSCARIGLTDSMRTDFRLVKYLAESFTRTLAANSECKSILMIFNSIQVPEKKFWYLKFIDSPTSLRDSSTSRKHGRNQKFK